MKRLLLVSSFLATTIFIVGSAYADPDAPQPWTGGELGVISTPPGLTYSSLGPQVNLEAPTFEQIPKAIYFEKSLEEKLLAKAQQNWLLEVNYDPSLEK